MLDPRRSLRPKRVLRPSGHVTLKSPFTSSRCGFPLVSNQTQIVSGALTFALAAGCPVVSTPYRYSRDVLSTGAGTIVETRDPALFADAILGYGLESDAAAEARKAAQSLVASMRWSVIGQVTAEVCRKSLRADIPNVANA